jgi:hypothetical protein
MNKDKQPKSFIGDNMFKIVSSEINELRRDSLILCAKLLSETELEIIYANKLLTNAIYQSSVKISSRTGTFKNINLDVLQLSTVIKVINIPTMDLFVLVTMDTNHVVSTLSGD